MRHHAQVNAFTNKNIARLSLPNFLQTIIVRARIVQLATSTPMLPHGLLLAFVVQWQDLEHALSSSHQHENPSKVIDSALDPAKPSYSTTRPTLFRERHGWCPYSERVWLTLEHFNVHYDTVKIDNTGPGSRPSYFSGQTPQMRWADGKTQGESMDLVREIYKTYGAADEGGDESKLVWEKSEMFRRIFPSKSRPSSRAAFLFGWNGEPLWKTEFERVLSQTDELLGDNGPFFCRASFSPADICWAPFLERYAAQLPCLHDDLNPRDPVRYPNLNKWFEAMETTIPAYACRVKGNASSWRKVLTMAGYGNNGVPPVVSERMNDLKILEGRPQTEKERVRDQALWDEYRSSRPYLARTPSAEAGSVLVKNRNAIVMDTLKQCTRSNSNSKSILTDEKQLDEAMRALSTILVYGADEDGMYDELNIASKEAYNVDGVLDLAAFLDERMCVPRDMGAMSADAIKRVATAK
ncbi:hypothetical protein HJC23_010415 [Cyclotella cryptica]|uniref:GST N-terminal domain-containing protein n=1 Tax=Cyclotella cryptica TaxID=29204 RepID=A0ABD3QHD1_9STRA|eukprot:CCRYP_005279-RA/>CCRYP_005279-RA protein AED:0.35 eAED:0.35 QI:0/-1/0/1/-1/1/1/0/466